jgi:hypothetical protein
MVRRERNSLSAIAAFLSPSARSSTHFARGLSARLDCSAWRLGPPRDRARTMSAKTFRDHLAAGLAPSRLSSSSAPECGFEVRIGERGERLRRDNRSRSELGRPLPFADDLKPMGFGCFIERSSSMPARQRTVAAPLSPTARLGDGRVGTRRRFHRRRARRVGQPGRLRPGCATGAVRVALRSARKAPGPRRHGPSAGSPRRARTRASVTRATVRGNVETKRSPRTGSADSAASVQRPSSSSRRERRRESKGA